MVEAGPDQNNELAKAYATALAWSVDRTARWAELNLDKENCEATAGYMLALTRNLAMARMSDKLRKTCGQLGGLWARLGAHGKDSALRVLQAILKELNERGDFQRKDLDLDLVIELTLSLIDLMETGSSIVTSVLHTVANIYQSQCRAAEASGMRRRELESLGPAGGKSEGASVIENWEKSADAGDLGAALSSLGQLCDLVIQNEALGFPALLELLLDLLAYSLKNNQMERIDTIDDVLVRLSYEKTVGADDYGEVLTALRAIAKVYEQKQMSYECARMLKQMIVLEVRSGVVTAGTIESLQKYLKLCAGSKEQEQREEFCEKLSKQAENLCGSAESGQHAARLKQICDQVVQAERRLQGAKDALSKARANEEEAPLAFISALLSLASQYTAPGHEAELKSLFDEAVDAYCNCPVDTTFGRGTTEIWQFALNYCARLPDAIETCLRPLVTVTVERIKKGEPLRNVQNYLGLIPNHFRGQEASESIKGLLDSIWNAAEEVAAVTPEDRLGRLRLKVQRLQGQKHSSENIEHCQQILAEGREIAQEMDGDACQAVSLHQQVAYIYLNQDSPQAALDCIKTAIEFCAPCQKPSHVRFLRELWQFIQHQVARCLPMDELIIPLFIACEERGLNEHEEAEVHRALWDAFHGLKRAGRSEDARRLLDEAIAIRETKRGKECAQLLPLLGTLAAQLEESDELVECEVTHKRELHIAEKCFGSKSFQLRAERMTAASFYVRHDMFEKANELWRKCLALYNPAASDDGEVSVKSKPTAMPTSDLNQLRSLAALFVSKGGLAEAEAIVRLLWPCCDESNMHGVDDLMDTLVDCYITAGMEDRSHQLIADRSELESDCKSATSRWRLTLSERCLARGEYVESKGHFDKVVESMTERGIDTASALRRRAVLLRRHGHEKEALEIARRLPSQKKGPCFEFALFGVEEVSLTGNVAIQSGGSAPDVFGLRHIRQMRHSGNAGYIGSYGQVRLQGNAQFLGQVAQSGSGNISPGPPRTKPHYLTAQMIQGPPSASEQREPPSVKEYVVAPPLSADIEKEQGDEGGLKKNACRVRASLTGLIEPGDYVVTDLQVGGISCQKTGRVRIFIIDDGGSDATAIRIGSAQASNQPINLQFWYDGRREIIIDHNSHLVATIYAPNATVRLGPSNVTLFGAIVANRIIGDGNITVVFDESLAGVDLGE